jgi:hypothetical protein
VALLQATADLDVVTTGHANSRGLFVTRTEVAQHLATQVAGCPRDAVIAQFSVRSKRRDQ